jgi:hypothetical protein
LQNVIAGGEDNVGSSEQNQEIVGVLSKGIFEDLDFLTHFGRDGYYTHAVKRI